MSKLPMKRILICGLRNDGKAILDVLQRAGVVEVSAFDMDDNSFLTNEYNESKLSFDRYVKNCDDALEILDKYIVDKNNNMLSSLESGKVIDTFEYSKRTADVKHIVKKVSDILNISKEIEESKQEIPKLENKILQYEPWKSLDIPLSSEGTDKTFIFVGSLKNEVSKEDIYNGVLGTLDEEISRYVDINILSTSKDMTCIMVVVLKEYKEVVEDNLKKMDFMKAPISFYVPSEEIKKMESLIDDINKKISDDESKIKSYSTDREDIKFTRDYYKLRSDKYDTISKIGLTDNAYFIEGYVPAKYADALVKKIDDTVDAYVEISDPSEDEDVPVCLQNGFFADPMETVVDSYSLPSKSEFDPSKILSVFYYVFFGMMLSDAGYGLLIVIGTAFVLLKTKNMKPESKKLIKLFFYSGISTVVWGILFGSFFGDSVDIIAHVFFGVPEEQQVLVPFLKSLHLYWFEPVKEPMRLLVFAFILGIIHLFTGLFLKFYILVKQGLIKDAIYDVVFWFMFVAGGICCLLGMDMVTNMLGLSFTLSKSASTIAGIVTALGALGVVLTGGRESKNWFKRILKGAYAAYGVTGWLSDILSYSRILALGLATGVIAQVFNKMGSMVQIPFVGAIIFILVFVVGHVLNLGINILGAYVHTNRLQFVEFFGKFYEGGGKKYTPFTENTKFYHVKEEK